ncbi:MAG: hypothetical protein IPO41_03960 [Acidobacteria bacterium]|nr:hypothetical protein [Acidobacteriota bacterium]
MALCDTCAIALAEAESEATFVFSALDRELDTLVPTHRLWNKINDSIAEEKAQMPWWHKAWALVSVGLMNPSIAVAASLVIVVGVFAAVWMNRAPVNSPVPSNQIATSKPNATTTAPPPVDNNIMVSDVPDTVVSSDTPRIQRAAFQGRASTCDSRSGSCQIGLNKLCRSARGRIELRKHDIESLEDGRRQERRRPAAFAACSI